MIHIAYSLHDPSGNYSRLVGTSIVSLLNNTTSEVCIHLLHDNTLTEDNYQKIKYIVESRNQEIYFYNVEELIPDKINDIKIRFNKISRVTIGSIYRLLLIDILDPVIEKILYLDADTIIEIDINELWNHDISNYVLGAVPEIKATRGFCVPQYLCEIGKVKREKYFNAGVLLINLQKFRLNNNILADGIKLLVDNPQSLNFDQDILNYFFADSYLELDMIFDIFVCAEDNFNDHNKLKCVGIRHYAGNSYTIFPTLDFSRFMFLHYFSLTPWFDDKFIGLAFTLIGKMINRKQKMFLNLLKEFYGKKIICLHLNFYKSLIERHFDFMNFADYIDIEPILSNQENVYKLTSENLYLIFAPLSIYSQIKTSLVEAGFIEGKHFFYGLDFMPEENCLKDSMYLPYTI